jgi:cyclic beta-1,2-glucan synthetase
LKAGKKLSAYLQPLLVRLCGHSRRRPVADEAPLRGELFSACQMEQHGKALATSHLLATSHSLAAGPAVDQLLDRLAANESALVEVCRLLTAAGTENRRSMPAGEWLLDNFYLIEEQISTARRHLPKGYSRELPRLARGPSADCPRVYDLALESIAHGDGRVDTETLSRFVAAYQTVTVLNLGELWAVPIMLRLALIENLRRVGVRIAAAWDERNLANSWADRMTETAEKDPGSLILVIADMARSNPPMVGAFVAELARRLQGRGPALALPLTWIEQRLSASGLTIEHLVQLENQQQASDQVSISNSIGSLRMLGALDWREFVETMSVVEQTLLEDPDGVYGRMDFATRDRYRHATEKIARKCHRGEVEVARSAVELARAAALQDTVSSASDRRRHVGFYLIDEGLPDLRRRLGARPSAREAWRIRAGRWSLTLYLGSIGLTTLILSGALLSFGLYSGALAGRAWALLPLGMLSLLAASQLAVALTNWLAAWLVAPRSLPRMDFDEGIPPTLRTLVVVPTMLSSLANVEQLVEALEVRFLANRDPCLHFGLLTDFCDADLESLPGDEPLLQRARTRIDELNEKYRRPAGGGRGNSFLLFHRSRQWNVHDRVWMGHERKRGKLAALNLLLRGGAGAASANGFALVVGDTAVLGSIRYVITLDTDTQLPRDAARQFVGTMAHPLNRPVYDAAKERVTEGYGILQPRVAISLSGCSRSRYARLYGGEPGIDPYTRVSSDVYQDLFGEGSFVGKGIYDVDAFEQALANRFPDNRILSHDLLEGCHARAGLLSDVHLYEDYPARYSTDVSRRYRWIRGDWQLAGWLLRRVPAAASAGCGAAEAGDKSAGQGASTAQGSPRRRNPLSLLSQWKLFDNLRRSLVPAAMTLLLLLGWTLLSSVAGAWTVAVIAIIVLPSLCASIIELLRKPVEASLRQHLAAVSRSACRQFMQMIFELACLPYEAFFSLDAIVRTHWRLLITRRGLLEWNPSSEAGRQPQRRAGSELAACLRAMWMAPALAMAMALHLAASAPAVLAMAAPILLLWFVSPLFAWWLSRPLRRREATLSAEQTFFLHALARRTWAFFEHLVGPEDHWLPPDNYQTYRVVAVAHRTSPTNIGMALLANLAAYDFGYLPAGGLLQRTANTLRTLAGLEQYRGHFYNWYDTQTLQPLLPRYISTVDSGNLAGHLLTLRAGLLALADDPITAVRLFDGLRDTYRILVAEVQEAANDSQCSASATRLLATFDSELQTVVAYPPASLPALHSCLERLLAGADEMVGQFAGHFADRFAGPPAAGPALDGGGKSESDGKGQPGEWAEALARQCRSARDELVFLSPWLVLPVESTGLATDLAGIGEMPTLRTLATLDAALSTELARLCATAASAEQRAWLAELRQRLTTGSERARERLTTIDALAVAAGDIASMEYDFLFDRTRHLLTIGYNVDERRADASYYDLLASEARLSCFVGIAQGQLPQESWFALGRLLTRTSGDPVLLSWSGSMFEYLMPLLVMPTYDGTLLDQTCKAAVARQIEYGKDRGVPWGISESGYNTVDGQLNYQYRAFGVPGLGLKRGLAEDLVIAPYASALALMVAPEASCRNLQRLAAQGFIGRFGFFEAIDYTPARQRRGQARVVVRSFMSHHQGMSLLALAYQLLDRPMQRRFASDRLFQAAMLLLQERVPKATALFSHGAQLADVRPTALGAEMPMRVFNTPDTPIPEVQLLSNGRYHVMLTNAGGGYSRWKDLAVTRWREDSTCDNRGSFCYLCEVVNGVRSEPWSIAHQPTLKRAASYEAIFSEGRAEFRRHDAVAGGVGDFETYTEIVVSPEDDIELRRVRVTNRSRQRREIEVTSYAEVVLAPAAADALHPAFSNLFVQTEILRDRQAILCTRRPRSLGEQSPSMLHLMAVHGAEAGEASYETDRLRFVGRTRDAGAPLAMRDAARLSGSEGSVLDPVLAIRYRIVIEAEATALIDIVSGIGESRDLALGLIEKYQDQHLADRVFDLAWTHSQVVLQQINASESDAQLHARLASSVIYANPSLRADSEVLTRNRRGQSGLWGYAISGDLPIVLLQIADGANLDLVRQLVQAHAYWRLKGLAVDLVIWNEDLAGYRQTLQEQIMGLIASGLGANVIDRPGGIFVRQGEQISVEDRILFQSVARAVISDSRGSLAEQLDHRRLLDPRLPRLTAQRARRREPSSEAHAAAASLARDLILDNGLGGFSHDGREYIIVLPPGQVTPAPWVNVLANASFGTIVSESGVAYTWSENAHEFRLTPWHNDPVSDASGEALYLRDEKTGHFWSPTPLPVRAETPYLTRHGFGYSVFETHAEGIHSELSVYVATDAAVKFSLLKVRNDSGRPRRLSATGYVEWVLGDLRANRLMHVITEIDPRSGTLYARNPYSPEFAERVAFFDVDDPARHLTGDRSGIHRAQRFSCAIRPPCTARAFPAGSAPAWTPCGAIQVTFELADGQEREIVFPARCRAQRLRGEQADAALPRCPGGARRARSRRAALAAHAGCGAGRNPRPVGQCAGQRLAGVPDPRVSCLGAQRLLPVGRRLRLPRPAAGRDGADSRRARAGP